MPDFSLRAGPTRTIYMRAELPLKGSSFRGVAYSGATVAL
jgi:hypothetical protein